jgi:hypothetical protein
LPCIRIPFLCRAFAFAFCCHPSPQAEDLLLAFAVVAGRIGIWYASPFNNKKNA